jgi:hypothetical protein
VPITIVIGTFLFALPLLFPLLFLFLFLLLLLLLLYLTTSLLASFAGKDEKGTTP